MNEFRYVSSRTTTTCALICACVLVAALRPSAAADAPVDDPVQRILSAGPEQDFAVDWLERLCDEVGPRLSGSPELDRAIAFSVTTLETAGFDEVRAEPVMVPAWHRGTESARVVAPFAADLPISGLGRSVGTPAGGLEAEVLAVRDFAELEARAAEARGRIVLFDAPWEGYGTTVRYRTEGAIEAAKLGAVAVLVRSVTGKSLATLHTGVMKYDDDVPRIPAASITVEDAARLHRLTKRGVAVRVHLEMNARNLPDREQANVVAELRGRERPDEIVVLACHLDSWDVGTGAHDDGAGCAIAAGAAHLVHSLGLRPRRTLRVVLYASEEFGGQAGEGYLEAHREELDLHVAAIESDSGCFPPAGFTARTTPEILSRLQSLAAPLEALGAAKVGEGWAGVDIGPIVEQGVPGLAHRTHHERYFDYHHSSADTFDKIDPDDLRSNVAAVAALAFLIADDPVSLRDLAVANGE